MKLLLDGVDDFGEETGYTSYAFDPGEKAPREWYPMRDRIVSFDANPTTGVYLKYPIMEIKDWVQEWLDKSCKGYKINAGRWYDYTDHDHIFFAYILFDDPADKVLFHFLFVMSGKS